MPKGRGFKGEILVSEEQAAKAGAFEGWAVIEVLGHRRLAGYVTDVAMFGTAMCRIDIPGEDGATLGTQYYSGNSLFSVTPCSEEVARAVAKQNQPRPVQTWEMPALAQRHDDDDDVPY